MPFGSQSCEDVKTGLAIPIRFLGHQCLSAVSPVRTLPNKMNMPTSLQRSPMPFGSQSCEDVSITRETTLEDESPMPFGSQSCEDGTLTHYDEGGFASPMPFGSQSCEDPL